MRSSPPEAETPANGEFSTPPETPHENSRTTPSLPTPERHGSATADSPKPKTSKPLKFVPGWLLDALKTKRTWKNWARSMIALFVTTLLMVIKPAADSLGQATFFGIIAAVMLPPMMPLSILIFALITMCLGMCLGWAWGTAAWAASLSVRSQALIQEKMQLVQGQAQAAGVDPRLATQSAIFKGVFLDARSSALTGAFIFLGCYFFGWLRATKPKLMLLSIFGTIVLDMMCSFGPLFPTPYYLLASTLIKPAAAYAAVALVCAVLFFPQSLNHLILSMLVGQCLNPMMKVLKLQDRVLSSNPTHHEEWHALAVESAGYAKMFTATYSGIEEQGKMLQLEVTRGRISAGQLTAVIGKTRALVATSLSLLSTTKMVDERDRALKAHLENPLPYSTARTKAIHGEVYAAEKESGQNFEDLLPDLKAETANLRSAAETAFQGGINFLDMINNTRWKKTPKDFYAPEVRQANLIRLRAALNEFRNSGRNVALDKFKEHFDPKTGQLLGVDRSPGAGSPRGLFRAFQFTATLTAFCIALIDWLQLLEVIELGTPRNKLQFPGKFVHEIVRNANDNTVDFQNTDGDLLDREGSHEDIDSDDPLEDNGSDTTRVNKQDRGADLKSKTKYEPCDPDAGPPTNVFQKFGSLISKIMRGLTGDNGIFALKYGIVTIAMWIPAVVPRSAGFVYQNRGLWALIMAQTGLGIFTGEQVFNFIERMSGTLLGAVFGMVLWYIGAQRTDGRAYGVTAALMVGMAPFLFLRIAAPWAQSGFYVMLAVTVVFVVGYSWVDNHTVSSANQGVGYTLAGRRALLVIIGFAASFVMILVPRPISAKKVVRQGLAKNIGALSDLYALELSALERARTAGPSSNEGEGRERRQRFRSQFLRVFGRIEALQQRIAFATLEPAMRGPWPKEKYLKLVMIQESMLGSSALLSAAYSQLEPGWIQRLTNQSDLMHPAFVADILGLFNILRHSLRQGTPLPPIIPIFERLAYHREYRANQRSSKGITEAPRSDLLPGERSALSTLEHDITWDSAHNEQFTLYATALIAIAHFIGGLNSLHMTVLSLVGERSVAGFDTATQRWAEAELNA